MLVRRHVVRNAEASSTHCHRASSAPLVTILFLLQPHEDRRIMPAHSRLSRPREVCLIATLSATQAMQEAGLGLVMAPLDIIGDSFGTTEPGELSWFAASYSLTVGTFMLLGGRWGDVYGHKKLLLVGWAWFALWSFITGFSVFVPHFITLLPFYHTLFLHSLSILHKGIGVAGALRTPCTAVE